MIKTINLELSKRLQEYLEGVETEYVITDYWKIYYSNEIRIINTEDKNSAMYWEWKPYWKFSDKVHPVCLSSTKHYDWIFKTLTLEEAIEFLPWSIIKDNKVYNLSFWKNIVFYLWKESKDHIDNDWIKCYLSYWSYLTFKDTENIIQWKPLLEAIESMITHLLDNNLLKQWTGQNPN